VKSTARKSSRSHRISVRLSPTQWRRLVVHAKKRQLKVAAAARAFLDEHLSELESHAELMAAEEWQRAQAWATWEKIKAGDAREASLEELRAIFAEARRS